jgi:hypothetical protein
MPTALGTPRSVVLGGLTLDVVDDQGVTWITTGLDGWRGSPATTLQVTQRPAAPGGWASTNVQLVARQMELDVFIGGGDSASATAAYEQLLAAVGTGPVVLQVTEDGTVRQMTVYRNGAILPTADGGTWTTYSVPLIAPDPRRYTANPVDVSIMLPFATGGLTWPVTWPISWPATVVSGDAGLPNAGTTAADPVITLWGPTTGSTPLTGASLTLTGAVEQQVAYSGDISPGDWVVVDCGARTVLYNGQSTRRGFLQLDNGWPQVPPGGCNAAFRAPTYLSTARAEVSYRSAWL